MSKCSRPTKGSHDIFYATFKIEEICDLAELGRCSTSVVKVPKSSSFLRRVRVQTWKKPSAPQRRSPTALAATD
eukprot:6205246-Pleurochrysis_carterae.AAC.1